MHAENLVFWLSLISIILRNPWERVACPVKCKKYFLAYLEDNIEQHFCGSGKGVYQGFG